MGGARLLADGHVYVHGTPEHSRALVGIVNDAMRPCLLRGQHAALLELPPFGNPSGDTQYGSQRADPGSVADVNDALGVVAAGNAAVTFVSWADVIAPDGRYVAEVDGVTVRADGVHIAGESGARLVTDRLVPILRTLAVDAHEAQRRSRTLNRRPGRVGDGLANAPFTDLSVDSPSADPASTDGPLAARAVAPAMTTPSMVRVSCSDGWAGVHHRGATTRGPPTRGGPFSCHELARVPAA